MNDSELKSFVEKFAQDQKAFHEVFATAWLKAVHLGHDEGLINLENMLEDHPNRVLHDKYNFGN